MWRACAHLARAFEGSFFVGDGDAEARESRAGEGGILQECPEVVHLQRNIHHVQAQGLQSCIVHERAAAVRDWVANDAEDSG